MLGSYPAFEHGLAAYFEARHFDPESVDFARPILERATVLMPSQAVLPCIITLTHPCILLDGRLWIVSSPPSGGGDRRKESSSGLGSLAAAGGGELDFDPAAGLSVKRVAELEDTVAHLQVSG